MVKIIFIGIGSFVALILMLLGVIYFLLTREPVISPLPSESPSEMTQESPEAAARLEEKIRTLNQEIEEAQTTGEQKQVTLIVTDAEINSLISQQLTTEKPADLPIDLQEIKVYFRQGLLYIIVRGKAEVMSFTALVTGEISVKAGKPALIIKSIDMGKLPLPGTIAEKLTALLNEQFQKSITANMPLEITSIVTTEGQAVVTGVTK